jgi:hypothetical protein
MIGDGDGDTTRTWEIDPDETDILEEIFHLIEILDKLRPPKGYWGLTFDKQHLDLCVEEKQITEEEKDFLLSEEFWDLIIKDCCDTREWVSFEHYHLTYIDEDGIEHSCKWHKKHDI